MPRAAKQKAGEYVALLDQEVGLAEMLALAAGQPFARAQHEAEHRAEWARRQRLSPVQRARLERREATELDELLAHAEAEQAERERRLLAG